MDVTDPRPELVFDEARRLLVRQEADLDTLRTRALALLSSAGVIAGLFAGRVTQHTTGFHRWSMIVALVLFAVTALLVVGIMFPREFTFAHDPATWISDLREGRAPDALEFTANLSRDFETYRAANRPRIKCLYSMFTWACVLLGLQVMAWGVAAL